MRTLGIKLRLIRTMQTNNLMPDKILPRLQRPRNRLTPQTWTPVPVTKRLLEPLPRLNRALQQPLLPDLEPVRRRAVECGAVVGVVGAVREPCDHGPDGVHPVCVDGGDVLAGCDGDVRARGVSGGVAREGGVGGREDGIIGDPFALDHPICGVLHGLVAVGVVAGWKMSEMS